MNTVNEGIKVEQENVNNSNLDFRIFNNFPTGLVIIKNTDKKNNFSFIFVNEYAGNVLNSPNENSLENNLKMFKKIDLLDQKGNSKFDPNYNLYQYLKEDLNEFSFCNEKFIYDEIMIYVKLKKFTEYILISIENLSDDRKIMEQNLFKNIRSQLLTTLSHEINNPMNSLIHTVEEITNSMDYTNLNLDVLKSLKIVIENNLVMIKFFIKNFIITFRVVTEGNDFFSKTKFNKDNSNHQNQKNLVNLHFLFHKIKNKFKDLYIDKDIQIIDNFFLLKHTIVNYDFSYLKWLLKNIYMNFLINSNKSEILKIDVEIINDYNLSITFEIIKYKNSKNTNVSNFSKNFLNEFDIESSVRTKDILKDNIKSLADFLEIKISFLNENLLKLYIKYSLENLSEIEDLGQEISPLMSKQKNVNIISKDIIASIIGKSVDLTKIKSNLINNIKNNINSIERRSSVHNDYSGDNSLSFKKENILRNNTRCKTVYLNKSNKFLSTNNINKNSAEQRDKVFTEKYNYTSNRIKTLINPKSKKSCFNPVINDRENSFYEDQIIDVHNTEISIPIPLNFIINEHTKQFHKNSEEFTITPIQFSSNSYNSMSSEYCMEIEEEEKSFEFKNILIVDDEIFNLNIMKSILKRFKVNCDTCMNGLECLEKLKIKEYDMILMDVMMPIMDGIEASYKIQEMILEGKINENLIIVIISAHSVEEIKEKAKKIKIVKEFLSKPVSKSKITELLEKYYII